MVVADTSPCRLIRATRSCSEGFQLHHRRHQTVGGFKKCFEELAQAHEKALRTPNSTMFGSQDGRQDFGKADTQPNTKADLKKALRTPDSTQFGEKAN